VKDTDVLEWRVRTISLAQQMEPQIKVPREASTYIRRRLAPVISSTERLVVAAMDDVCRKALKLALRFRSTKTRYIWETEAHRGAPFNEAEMDIVGSLGPGSEPEFGVVHSVVFGSVVKFPEIDDEDNRIVLRRAEVVMDPTRRASTR
jgi:hypothetical protein